MDNVREYAKVVIWEGLTEMVRHDAVRENDGERIIRHGDLTCPDLTK